MPPGDPRQPPQQRPIRLVVLVMLALGLATAGTALAADGPRDAPAETNPPVIVFQGEILNVSAVRQTGAGEPLGTGPVSFVGLRGDADGAFESVDSGQRVDFSDLAAGTYDTNGDGAADVAVRTPEISRLTVTTNGVDVTGQRVPEGATVEIGARYNFDAADRVEVRVLDPTGTDITPQVIGGGTANWIRTSGESVTATFAGEPAGEYTVVAAASDLEAERRSPLAVRNRQTVLTLSRATVTRGERVRATVVGDPGDTVHVRLSGDVLGRGLQPTDEAAERVFESAPQVRSRTGNRARNAIGAVLRIGEDRQAQVWINTEALRPDRTVRVELGRGTDFSASVLDSRDLRIEAPQLAIDRVPRTVPIGGEFTIAGTAPNSATVKAYAQTDGDWVPLFASGDAYAEAVVQSEDAFELTIDTTRVIDAPGTYPIAVVGNATERYASDRVLTTAEVTDGSLAETTVRTTSGRLTAALSRTDVLIESGTTVTLTSETRSRQVHLFLVTPTGRVESAEAVTVSDGQFERQYGGFDRRGQYRFVLVGPGHDGAFQPDATPEAIRLRLGGDETQQAALRTIVDAYAGTGADDQLVELALRVGGPTLSVDPIGSDGVAAPGVVDIAGTSNRPAGAPVDVAIRRDGEVVATATADVDARGRWAAAVDLGDATLGTYAVVAHDGAITASRELTLAESATPTPTETATVTPTESPTQTPTATATEPTPGGTGAGFTVGVALLAMAVAAIGWLRR